MSVVLMQVLSIIVAVGFLTMISLGIASLINLIRIVELKMFLHGVVGGMWATWGIYCVILSRGTFDIWLNVLGFGVPLLAYFVFAMLKK